MKKTTKNTETVTAEAVKAVSIHAHNKHPQLLYMKVDSAAGDRWFGLDTDGADSMAQQLRGAVLRRVRPLARPETPDDEASVDRAYAVANRFIADYQASGVPVEVMTSVLAITFGAQQIAAKGKAGGDQLAESAAGLVRVLTIEERAAPAWIDWPSASGPPN
jgi:hypothetical protein